MKSSKSNQGKINCPTATLLVLSLATFAMVMTEALERGGRRVETGNSRLGFNSTCGNEDQVSVMMGHCIKPVLDFTTGVDVEEAKSDADIQAACKRFEDCEKCIRNVSKDCLKGVHKTTSSAMATAMKRYRTNECKTEALRSRYYEPIKCLRLTGEEMAALLRNATAVGQAVRDMQGSSESKLTKVCCIFEYLDKHIEAIYERACPESAKIMKSIFDVMTQDAKSTLCAKPKCSPYAKLFVNPQLKDKNENLITPLYGIFFRLNND